MDSVTKAIREAKKAKKADTVANGRKFGSKNSKAKKRNYAANEAKAIQKGFEAVDGFDIAREKTKHKRIQMNSVEDVKRAQAAAFQGIKKRKPYDGAAKRKAAIQKQFEVDKSSAT